MKFIDFHCHIYPYKIAKRATEYLTSTFTVKAEWPATSENLLIFGQAAGISKYVVLPVAQKVEQVRKINDFAISENNSEEKFLCFGTLHAALENICEEIDYIKNSGLHGIKIHPDQQGFSIDDPRLFPAYDYLSQLNFPVLFHCGDKKILLSHPERTKKVIKMFPKLNMICAHFGGWEIFDISHELLAKEDVHFDMSSAMPYLGPEKTAQFIKDYGAEKIFFGTDFPLWGQENEIRRFMELNISDREKEMIAHENAEIFFKEQGLEI